MGWHSLISSNHFDLSVFGLLMLSRSVDELCELKAELFAITYTRYQFAQISLKFVYGGALPGNITFTRKLGPFVYFTE